MAGRGLLVLLAAFELAFGARPWPPQKSGFKPVLSSEAVPTQNKTQDGGAALALVQQGQTNIAPFKGPVCPAPEATTESESWSEWIKNQVRTDPKAPRKCSRVWGEMWCTTAAKEKKLITFGDDSLYVCGKNDFRDHGKVFYSKTTQCSVLIKKVELIRADGKFCSCTPCRISVEVAALDAAYNKDSFTTTPWSGPGSVWNSLIRTQKADTRTRSDKMWLSMAESGHRLNVWISGHPIIVTCIKVGLLIIIGAATGGIGTGVALAVGVGWTVAMAVRDTANKAQRIAELQASGLSDQAKIACISAEGAKWAIGMVFSTAALFFPFSQEIFTTMANANLGTLVANQMLAKGGADSLVAATLASYGVGEVQGYTKDQAIKYMEGVSTLSILCQDTTDIAWNTEAPGHNTGKPAGWAQIPAAASCAETDGICEVPLNTEYD